MVGAVSQVQTIRSRAPHTDGEAATVIALVFGAGAAVLAVETAWSTGIVRVIPPLLHGYADIAVTAAMIVLPFAVGFTSHTTALAFHWSSAPVVCSQRSRRGSSRRCRQSMP
jgi:hypothetical protein